MAYDSFATSGVVDTSAIATGAVAPTAIMPSLTATRIAKLIVFQSDASSDVELFLNWDTDAPVVADTGNFWLQAGKTLILPMAEIGRFISPQVYARVALASTGNIIVNVVY
jgi:hypothetical protein